MAVMLRRGEASIGRTRSMKYPMISNIRDVVVRISNLSILGCRVAPKSVEHDIRRLSVGVHISSLCLYNVG